MSWLPTLAILEKVLFFNFEIHLYNYVQGYYCYMYKVSPVIAIPAVETSMIVSVPSHSINL